MRTALIAFSCFGLVSLAAPALARTDDTDYVKGMSRCRAVGESLKVQVDGYYKAAVAPGNTTSASDLKAITDMQKSIDDDYLSVFGLADEPDQATKDEMNGKTFDELMDMTDGCYDMAQKLFSMLDADSSSSSSATSSKP